MVLTLRCVKRVESGREEDRGCLREGKEQRMEKGERGDTEGRLCGLRRGDHWMEQQPGEGGGRRRVSWERGEKKRRESEGRG